MQTILDVKSISGKIIRFVFTPAGEETLFKTIRDHDLISVIDRSRPTTDDHLKDHGSLLFGDNPKNVFEVISNESLYHYQRYIEEPFTAETLQLIKSWIDMHKETVTQNQIVR